MVYVLLGGALDFVFVGVVVSVVVGRRLTCWRKLSLISGRLAGGAGGGSGEALEVQSGEILVGGVLSDILSSLVVFSSHLG